MDRIVNKGMLMNITSPWTCIVLLIYTERPTAGSNSFEDTSLAQRIELQGLQGKTIRIVHYHLTHYFFSVHNGGGSIPMLDFGTPSKFRWLTLMYLNVKFLQEAVLRI